MKPIKIILISILILTLLSCNDHIPIIESDEAIYTDFEIGTNFTNHMLAIVSKDFSYREEMKRYINIGRYDSLVDKYTQLYTHEIDYLVPQIMYYIPSDYNLKSKEALSDYFDRWYRALSERDINLISEYVENTFLLDYVKDIFENTSDDIWSVYYMTIADLIEETGSIYVEAFEDYEKEVWPEISLTLYKRCNYLNETISSLNLSKKWFDLTGLEMDKQMLFSLLYYQPKDFEYTSISNNKYILFEGLYAEPTEFVQILSHHYGYKLLLLEHKGLINDSIKSYSFLNDDYNVEKIIKELFDFSVSEYNSFIFGFETEGMKKALDEGLFPIISPDKLTTSEHHLSLTIETYLNSLRDLKPYRIDGYMTYKGDVYNERRINDEVMVYYLRSHPIIIEDKEGYHVLTDTLDSIPEISPDRNRMVFISPFEWEEVGELYLYDINTSSLDVLISIEIEEQQSVKRVVWFDDETLYYIRGFAYGTVSRGGSLYKFDLITRESTLIDLDLTEHMEVSDIEKVGDQLEVEITIHDFYYTDYEIETRYIGVE